MRSFFALALVAILFLNGCVSVYKGPPPDTSLRGQAARDEADRFRMEESFWFQGGEAMGMGRDRTYYTIDSLEPSIKAVSPGAMDRLKTSRWFHQAGWATWGAAVAILAVQILNPVNIHDPGLSIAFWSLLGTSVGFSIARNIQTSRAAEDFNRDLGRQLTPEVAFNWAW